MDQTDPDQALISVGFTIPEAAQPEKRLRDMTWRERGAHDFAQGVEREPGPYPARTPEGDDWRAAWDEAQAATPETGDKVFRMVSVKAMIDGDGRLHAVDSEGRLLGTQTYINLEQTGLGNSLTVTFADVKIA